MNQQTEILELEVTDADIDKAFKTYNKGNGESIVKSCPIAIAAFRNKIPDVTLVTYNGTLSYEGRRDLWQCPDAVKFVRVAANFLGGDATIRPKPTKLIYTRTEQ